MVKRFPLGLAAVLAVAQGQGCERPACDPIEACDIRRTSCQREALRLARCMRDEHAKADIELEVVDYHTFVADRARDLETEPSDESVRLFREGLTAFALSVVEPPEDEAVTRWEWVGAFYNDGKVTVLDRGHALDSPDWTALLVHEMVHALQDASGDLSLLSDVSSFDAALAQRSIVEGEAELIEARTMIEGLGFEMGKVGFDRALSRYRRRSLLGSARSKDPFVQASLHFAYAFGASFLWDAMERNGADAVRSTFREPPSSTGAIMGDGSPVPAEDIAELEATATPQPTAELTPVGHARLGRFLFETFVRRFTNNDEVESDNAHDLGEKLVADAMTVLAGTTSPQSLVAVWRLRMRDEAAAQQLVALFNFRNAEGRSGRDGRDVWLAAGDVQRLPDNLAFRGLEGTDVGFARGDNDGLRCVLNPLDLP